MLNLDGQSGVPFYLQVVQQIKRLIVSGTILPGDQLPAVRELAKELVLNSNTVAKAYQELERDGVVESRRGLGTFACAPTSTMSALERRAEVQELLKKVLMEAEQIKVPADEVAAILTELIEERNGQRIAT